MSLAISLHTNKVESDLYSALEQIVLNHVKCSQLGDTKFWSASRSMSDSIYLSIELPQ